MAGLADLTHDDLDALADERGVDDYPRSGNKADKVAALEAAGVTGDDDTSDDVPRILRDNRSGIDPRLVEAREATAQAEADAAQVADDAPVNVRGVDRVTVVGADDFDAQRTAALKQEAAAGARDVREGPAQF